MEGRTDFKQTAYQFENLLYEHARFTGRNLQQNQQKKEKQENKENRGKNNTSTKHKLQ